MSDFLGTLRVARQAVNEGLLAAQDYDVVKIAFLKAQQIKAGLDAGFIRQEDYDKARDAFLHALDFNVMSTFPASSSAGGGGGPVPNGVAAAAALAVPPPAPPAAPASATNSQAPSRSNSGPLADALVAPAAARSAAGTATPPAAAAPAPAPVPPAAAAAAATATASVTLAARSASQSSGGGGGGGGSSGGSAAIPADLPDYCRGCTAGKKSMSGIAVDAVCVNLFTHIKTRSSNKWAIFRIDDSGTQVIVEQLGGKDSPWDDFVAALPEGTCRYGVYDYQYRSRERGTFNKLVFVTWSPDEAPTKNKMMYASTKDFFKGFLDGIQAELQATERDELSTAEVEGRVVSNMTRK